MIADFRREGWCLIDDTLFCATEWGCCGNGAACENDCWAGTLVVERFQATTEGWSTIWGDDEESIDAFWTADDETGTATLLTITPPQFHDWIRDKARVVAA